MSLPEGSEIAGNPIGIGEIPREKLGEFWVDFLTKPQPLNNYRTINEYWRENSFGKWQIELDAYGPYRMDYNEFQYGLNEFGQRVNMPPGYAPKNLRPEAVEKSQADIEASGVDYDFIFILHAGYAETGVWQEFGEMMFLGPEDVTDEFGPPFDDMPNWARTRYVPWTSGTPAQNESGPARVEVSPFRVKVMEWLLTPTNSVIFRVSVTTITILTVILSPVPTPVRGN